MQVMKKLILILIGVLAVIGAFIYKAVNKGPVNISSADAVEVPATQLYNEYLSDPAHAAGKYTTKILLVSGVAGEVIPPSGTRQGLIKIKTDRSGAYINCSIESGTAVADTGQIIRVKGICSGLGEGDADLGILGDVYLTRCMVAD